TVIGYVWGRGYNDALARWAKAKHEVKASYSNGGSHAPTKEAAAASVLSFFTDEEWAALVKARASGATPTQAVKAAVGAEPNAKLAAGVEAATKPAAKPKK